MADKITPFMKSKSTEMQIISVEQKTNKNDKPYIVLATQNNGNLKDNPGGFAVQTNIFYGSKDGSKTAIDKLSEGLKQAGIEVDKNDLESLVGESIKAQSQPQFQKDFEGNFVKDENDDFIPVMASEKEDAVQRYAVVMSSIEKSEHPVDKAQFLAEKEAHKQERINARNQQKEEQSIEEPQISSTREP